MPSQTGSHSGARGHGPHGSPVPSMPESVSPEDPWTLGPGQLSWGGRGAPVSHGCNCSGCPHRSCDRSEPRGQARPSLGY